jgi:hypothetical protein
MNVARRAFLRAVLGGLAVGRLARAGDDRQPSLAGEVGITTSSLDAHFTSTAPAAGSGRLRLEELPRVVRDELGLRIIDLNTTTLGSLDPDHLDRFRTSAEKAGCLLTNLKMNDASLDMGSPDPAVRRLALSGYKAAIDAAARLGLRWARPLPSRARPDMPAYVAGLRELAGYARDRGIGLLVENYGWMQSDPDAIPRLVEEVGRGLAACPDTGNWSSDETRRDGLARAFPLAVTCDFKARELGPHGEHAAYDLRRCFRAGWDGGFRGPWCLEHSHRDRTELFRELGLLRDMLRRWMENG